MSSTSGTRDHPVQSRRSHTKSRNGCKTCKKRHIRCDETVPQCRNCTKHNVRCDYMDGNMVEGHPDLAMNPQIQGELDTWRETGVYPFPSLELGNQPIPSRYSQTDLRLIHHISSIAAQMQAAEPGNSALWTKRVPMFLRIASRHDFVMNSLLGLSASHLSWLTASPATLQLAYQHRGFAFQGLQESIGNFSKENSDAVLAASILLSWQVTDWPSWASLLQGTATVIDAMEPWKHESEFAGFMAEKEIFSRGPFRQQIVDPTRDRHVVSHVYHALTMLYDYLDGHDQARKGLEDLINFVQGLHEHIPVHSGEAQFELLHPLRTWLFFLPIDFLRAKDDRVMVLLAHFYGVALAVEPLFPAVGAAYFGTMSVGPIEQIQRTLIKKSSSAINLMAFPLEMVKHFRERMDWRRAHVSSDARTPQQLEGWNWDAFPEYAMVEGHPQVIPTSTAQDAHSSASACDFIASAMWRGEALGF
ncbi:hypothetical protein BZA77DRAFT_245301 [Pyronema omphalodes]|nr:hypothetical protein BZA77DRAFT_245301 [Pyronema omphalodes]